MAKMVMDAYNGVPDSFDVVLDELGEIRVLPLFLKYITAKETRNALESAEERSPSPEPDTSNTVPDNPDFETEKEYTCCECKNTGKFKYARNEDEAICASCSHQKCSSCE
ncbi:hypothetical protein GGR58DRAFT_496759 [Xylaria digitata]|nr:hypothetical protein GGR58DRAFT_496759 [Xylaria digitata]